MKESNEIIRFVEKLCSDSSLELERSSENYFKINTDNASGISIILEIEKENKLSFYFIQRTYDIFYHGDRTDAHVVLSLMFSLFLRLSGLPISSSLFDIPHPIVEDEIWGRYIMPEQVPTFLGISSEEKLKDRIFNIIGLVSIWRRVFWEITGCPCDKCMQESKLDNRRDYELENGMIESLKELYNQSPHINYGSRMRPNWNYLYDMENEITIIKSKELSEYVETIISGSKITESVIKGVNGELIVDQDITNFISNDIKIEFQKLIESLNNNSLKHPIIPLENMLITVSNPYIIALGRLSGKSEFKLEREILRRRHNKEAEILFPIPSFLWLEKACPDQFENLIKALLEREPEIRSVRKPAPINQGDKGRDLIIEWNVIDKTIVSQSHPPTKLIKVVGQCKASKGTVGKGKVLDIRDTVETHNSQGYFLAVNSQISAPLTEKLESLKSKDVWTLWWNREDIELRLSKNQDLIPNFPKVVKVKHKIKFIDKD